MSDPAPSLPGRLCGSRHNGSSGPLCRAFLELHAERDQPRDAPREVLFDLPALGEIAGQHHRADLLAVESCSGDADARMVAIEPSKQRISSA